MPSNSQALSRETNLYNWIPALLVIVAICIESRNSMGSARTGFWLVELKHWTGHAGGVPDFVNTILRKGGHFTGYGLLGLGLAHGWRSILRRRMTLSWSGLRLRAAGFGVLSTAIVASCDEIHQAFLPTRVGCFHDVVLDTAGAITLNLALFACLSLRRRSLLYGPFTTLNLPRKIAGLAPSRVSGLERRSRLHA